MDCDLCGKETRLVQAEVEGTILSVCTSCAKLGRIIKQQAPKTTNIQKRVKKEGPVLMIVSDYAQKVRNARQKLRIEQEDLAKTTGQKLSVIQHIETAKLRPSIDLARRIGKVLNIRLVEEYTPPEDELKKESEAGEDLTLGHIANIRTRKKN